MLKVSSPSLVYSKLSTPSASPTATLAATTSGATTTSATDLEIELSPSHSGCIRNPRQLYNVKGQDRKPKEDKDNEFERMTHIVHNPDIHLFIQSVVMMPTSYASFAFSDSQMRNIERCCVLGSSPLRVDTTFEIVEGMWVTDTSFTNTALINERDSKHPEFPGPVMLHFQKDRPIFRRFATEIVNGNPNLLEIKKIGHDMDSATKNGFKDIFRKSESLICIQHVSARDKIKLQKLGTSQRSILEILADIYGFQKQCYLESGLADAIDEEEFNARLLSLEDVWEEKAPGFYRWFKLKRASLFIAQVIGEAQDRLEISERFTTNRLENLHRIQKRFCDEGECQGDAVAVMREFDRWIEMYDKEAEKAFYGQGKYRLAPGYSGFQHPKYIYWSSEEKREHQQKFLNFILLEANKYDKPSSPGLKKAMNDKPRRGNQEVELFGNRQLESIPKAAVQTEAASSSTEDLSFLDPFRRKEKKYFLVHRLDHRNCPKAVRRCEMCSTAFDSTDSVLIKSTGLRNVTCAKTGKQTRKNGNVYFHNLFGCVNDYDKKFTYSSVLCLKATAERLSKEAREKLIKLNLKMEQ